MKETSRPWWQASAVQLGQAYRSGQVTPSAVATACLARIAEVNPRLNAFVALREAFLQDAQASTERHARRQPLSLLDGVPLSIKDNLLTCDMPTSWGCRALAGHRSEEDETPVARARAAGALLVGKTNVPEFTLEGYTDNALFGTTRNPWNLALTPGGSSGGAVAGVASGCTPLALATDGGGSIRRPASHTGLVGFKPSLGAVAREHALPTLLLDFEVVGPIARTVADARLLFDALRGPTQRDRRSLAASAAATLASQGPAALPARVLYVPAMNGAAVDPEIAQCCLQAAGRLRQLGHHVTAGELPLDLRWMNESWPEVAQIGLAALFSSHPHWREDAATKYQAMATAGQALPASRLWQLIGEIDELRLACSRLFETYDLIVMPSAAALPWPAQEAFPPEIDGKKVGPRGHAVFTGWVNAAGLPAVALPASPAANGLPIGIQLIGAYGTDVALLDLAERYEALAPWAGRWPAL